MMRDINAKIVYQDKYKSFSLPRFISTIEEFTLPYKISHKLLSNDWSCPILDENSSRKNPSTRNAIYAYIEKVKSTDLEIPDELSDIFPTPKQPSSNILILLRELQSHIEFSTEYRYSIEEHKILFNNHTQKGS